MTDEIHDTTDSPGGDERAVTDGGTDEKPRTDGGPPATIPPDDETPTWRDRKERTQGLSRLTYQYFERSRREDEDLRAESTYVERDVLGFPAWPHETIRNLAITSFFVGIMLLISALMPPHFGDPANPGSTPAIILPDWYLYWSFGLLKLDPLNPDLAVLGGNIIMSNEFLGVIAHGVVFGAITLVPFLNKGSARRPVEEPFWAAIGMGGVVLSFTLAALAIQNFFPLALELIVTLTFLLPVIAAILTYAVLKTMREGYMYGLNRRYYMLRPPK